MFMFMFIRQSRQHYMPDIQRWTETVRRTNRQTENTDNMTNLTKTEEKNKQTH